MPTALHHGLQRLRSHARSQYFWPVMLLLAGCFGCILFLLIVTTRTQDSMQREREEQAARGAIMASADMALHDLEDYANWDEAVRYISHGLDLEWIDDNVVAYLGRTRGYGEVFVLNGRDRTIFSARTRAAGSGSAQQRLGPEFARSVGRVRAMPRDGAPIVSGYTRAGGEILVYANAAITPLTPKVSISPGPTHLLIIARKVDEALLTRAAREHRLDDLRIRLARPAAGAAFVPINGADGTAIAWLEWSPHQPGTLLLRQVAPVIIGLALLAIVAAGLILRHGSRAIEALRQSEMRARHHADHDLLTGLPNRRALIGRISEQITSGGGSVLLYMDLDGFKDANDVYGHGAGDRLLREAAKRIQIAAGAALVARAGGDEFAILLAGHRSALETSRICDMVLDQFEEPFVVGANRVILGISIGCANGDDLVPDEPDELMRRGDVAMYAAKADGKNCARNYVSSLDEGHRLRMTLEQDLQRSVTKEEFYVFYQPIVAADSRTVVGMEALARWSHPEHGQVPPDVFIPIAEMSGLINAIGRRVLYQACLAMRGLGLDLSVNLSPVQFWDRNFLADVREVLLETDFPPARLELEITESLLLRRPDKAAEIIDGLHGLGIRIALDDFGSGFASIGYLQKLNLDRIKVDKAFVAPLAHDPKSLDMLVSIVGLARAFGLEVTAEGVETAAQAQIASEAGCARLQGWLFGRPAAIEDFGRPPRLLSHAA